MLLLVLWCVLPNASAAAEFGGGQVFTAWMRRLLGRLERLPPLD